MTREYDTLIVGGGQSGLAAAYHLQRHGHHVAILEAGSEPVGSWPQYYDSLTLFSPARYSALPGMAFSGNPDRYPHRDEVADYLRTYAASLNADIHVRQRVESVTHDGHTFSARTVHGTTFTAPRLIAATGSFGSPHIPDLPGQDSFTGKILHASEYHSPHEFTGQRIIVVGAGNSAVQIAAELAEHSSVILASRSPVKFVPQRPLGRDLHFWFRLSGFDSLPIGHLLRTPPSQPVLDAGRYRAALTAGKPSATAIFTALHEDGVTWADGTRTLVNTIILATGYTPHLPYLAGIGALTDTGAPRHRKGVSTTHPGLGYLGLEWLRSPSSNSLRGVGRDAAHLTRRLHHLEPIPAPPRNKERSR